MIKRRKKGNKKAEQLFLSLLMHARAYMKDIAKDIALALLVTN